MKVIELEKILLEWSIPENLYSIMIGGLPNERLCLVKPSDEIWEVYYSERGRKSGVKLFKTEEEACEYFLKKNG